MIRLKFDPTRMSTKGIVITLLCVTCVSVHCARNSRESSELLRKCCFDSVDRSAKDYQSLCTFRISNHTSTTISYNPRDNISDMSCCTVCFDNTFERNVVTPKQRTGRKEEYTSANVRMNVRRFCFNDCVRRIQSIKTSRQRDYNEGNSINISRTETDKFHRINEDETVSVDGRTLDYKRVRCCLYRPMGIEIFTNDPTNSHVISYFAYTNNNANFFVQHFHFPQV